MIVPQIIKYKSADYEEMVRLRTKVLRKPLGLVFTEADLAKDENDILLALFLPPAHRMAGCCILTRMDDRTVKLRQVVVDTEKQKNGFGASLLSFAEYVAGKEGFEKITMHARKVAAGFYLKYGYKIIGEEFIEVGIPHFEMEKQLKMEKEKQQVIDEVSKYIDITLTPFGKPQRGIIDVEKRDPMYGGNGVVYMLSVFEKGELANNRIATYMVMPDKGDQAGFHEHGTKKEQELYVIVHGQGEYVERIGPDNITRKFDLKKGNITAIRGADNYHSIENTGDEPLIIFVVTTYEKKSDAE
jgi:predicted GNAT family N-acyltransferase/mannose-6-phosphate isomerase-like protein (cupin superfamily)